VHYDVNTMVTPPARERPPILLALAGVRAWLGLTVTVALAVWLVFAP
jgi:hypothetical protein